MSLQVCSYCGWSKVTTYHGLRIHQGKMGCTPKGVGVQQSKQPQYTWGHEERLDVYTPTKADYKSLQECHCGWSSITTYHGLRTHQGIMGCTPKGVRIPEEEQWYWNKWDEVDQKKHQPEKRGTFKKEVKLPTPRYLVTGDRPKKKDREDQTVSQISDSREMTGNWSINSQRHSTVTIKEEPKPPLANPHWSSESGCHVKVKDLVRKHQITVQKLSDARAQLTAVHPKEKDQADQKLTQVRSAKITADTTIKHKTQTREQMVAQGRSSAKAQRGMDADWLEINSVFSKVVRAATDAKQKSHDLSFSTLRTTTSTMMEQIHRQLEKLSAVELKWISEFAVDVKLDPTTAHRCLVSADGKKVRMDDPGRFGSVLGLNSLTPGRSYWEVVVGNNTGWNLGVARDDANHKGKPSLNPDNGYWVTEHYKNKYTAMTDTPVCLSLKEKPQKVGVFVDYEEGLVSFYDVTAESHIYSFTECCFNGEIYPYFSLHLKGDGESVYPLIISTVKHQ